ncbi:hypothetical protein FDZ74_17815 [bacterium]|nr:MAG: hypothetical protein FDZ74_17815 [bacterium]
MNDVFWLGDFSLQGSVNEGLHTLGLKAEWVQEMHVMGDAPEVSGKTIYRWPGQVAPAHRLLHFACQALHSGDLDLLVLLNGGEGAVLASPRAAGRWNLVPRASLSARFSYAPGTLTAQFLPALALQLLAGEIDPERSGWAAALEQAEFSLTPAFPAVEWLDQQADSLIPGLNRLCTALEARSAALGLLFSPGLATVIERV